MPETSFETRTMRAQFEVREDSAGPVLEGYAATFNHAYDLGPFREQIAPTAFSRTLGNGPDVRLLIDHEGQPLARTKSGTLTLSTDAHGLHARATLDPTDPDVQRLLPKMRRGDLDQMSFAFRVPSGGDVWENDYTLRTITEASLAGGDVSVVTYPANEATSVSVRARDLTEARCVFVDALVAEIRAGKAISAANAARLSDVLSSLATVDASLDTADAGLDDALAALSDVLGEANPDPVEANGLPLGLATAVAARLRLS